MPVENTRTIDLRLILVALAVVASVAAVWAATALAGGSSSSRSDQPQGDEPAAGLVQDEQKRGGGHTDRGDCPERDRAGMASTDI
jgi:hypothetical protein